MRFDGEGLRTRRQSRGWSRTKLAAAADIAEITLYSYETGRRTPSVTTAAGLARAIGCKVDDLVTAI